MSVNSSYISLDDTFIDPLEDSILLSTINQLDDNLTNLKKFLFRLVIELHSSGNLSFKTEEYIKKVGFSYSLHVNCIILPSFATIYFQQSHLLSPITTETYTIKIKNGLDFSKLDRLDLLCYNICGKNKLSSDLAIEQLNKISHTKPLLVYFLILYNPFLIFLLTFNCVNSFLPLSFAISYFSL